MVETEQDRRADAKARLRITEAALERLEELADDAPEHVVQRIRDRYGSRVERLEARVEGDHDEEGRSDVAIAGRLMAEMIDAERAVLKEMRSDGDYPAELLKEIEHELDLDESRLQARIRL
jgi:CPA1 family monovalent cation:H+ antiporter